MSTNSIRIAALLLGTVASVACAPSGGGADREAAAPASAGAVSEQAVVDPPRTPPDAPAPPAAFSHDGLDALLRKHVDQGGRVDYAGLHRDRAALNRYVESLGTVRLDGLERDEKLALLINAYNAFTLQLIVENWDGGRLKSIRDLERPWDQVRWKLESGTVSLNQIEHELIRPVFKEPRIHFALVCAAVGCPKLLDGAYRAERLEAQLERQTAEAHRHGRWFRFDEGGDTVGLTRLYDWYGDDFVQAAGSVLEHAARYAPALGAALKAGKKPRIEWLEYDWGLNRKAES